ncbi:MAG: TRAP transporter small permease subunit [Gammaproteobacteria bacterium]|nr:TRAP transporter small permease subunit [Gammaproteobacteria bacterium]MBU1443000.1 TRAP transporter small permease subunit [Gammaproteobacteria bacterium]MBU2286964.1 TRAP transporter small permease subunit [Gammaproteobacteria bacterium]MBU2410138.1 TRAP transporter small permease subunit [Gammaproteobacteria bacterium]
MKFILGPLRWLDRNAERSLILMAYSAMTLIIVYAVFERFILKQQVPWSTSIPIYLFLWVTWIGCSQNVRKRTHLVFNDFRLRMSYGLQFACMWLDAVLWIVFGAIVLYFTIEQTRLVEMNFAIVQGTDNIMQWWFYVATPLAWSLLIVRVLQNLWDDIRRWRRREPFLVAIQTIGD